MSRSRLRFAGAILSVQSALRFPHRAEGPDGFAVEFVQYLGEAHVDGCGTADDAFKAGEMIKGGTGFTVFADGEQEKQEGQ